MRRERGRAWRRWLACAGYLLAAVPLLLAGSRSHAEVPAIGTTVGGPFELAGKQIVLPDGEWVVAGHGYDQIAGLDDVPYGAIENVVLFRLAENRVAAFVIAQRNAVAIENGWGLAPECERTDLLGLVVYDGSENHSFCGFVNYVATAVDSTSARAWQAAMEFAGSRSLTLPPGWLMAGFRRNDLTDTLDVRYHFDPALAGYPATPAPTAISADWSRERIYGRATSGAWGVVGGVAQHLAFWHTPPVREPAAIPAMEARADVVNDLREWLAKMRYAIQLGYQNRASLLASVPMPWDPADEVFQPELATRLAALAQLAEAKVIAPEEYARQRAIAEALSAPEAGHRWTAEELTAVKLVTDQISGAVSYFAADLIYTGTVQTASQIWALDQVIDAGRYTALEYGWQRLGPRRLATDGVVVLPGAGMGG